MSCAIYSTDFDIIISVFFEKDNQPDFASAQPEVFICHQTGNAVSPLSTLSRQKQASDHTENDPKPAQFFIKSFHANYRAPIFSNFSLQSPG